LNESQFDGTVTIDGSRYVKFFKDFYCIGFEKEKVSKGIEDNREMRKVDNSKPWNPGTKVCMKNFYNEVGFTKSELEEMNKKIWLIPEIK